MGRIGSGVVVVDTIATTRTRCRCVQRYDIDARAAEDIGRVGNISRGRVIRDDISGIGGNCDRGGEIQLLPSAGGLIDKWSLLSVSDPNCSRAFLYGCRYCATPCRTAPR